ncbi:MAG TPA: hypothetical protein VJZ94_00065 [Candidatus Paceibacterota bacterium]|nr:hypothetical protein [Candidatus Paceibacterota bacterium]
MSTTYIAALVGLVSTVASLFGWTVGTEELTRSITDIIAIGSLIYVFYGRFKAGGISAFGFRKASK